LLAGIGAGTFIYSYPAYKSDDIKADRIYNNAHNDHAQFMAEFGLPAFLLLALAVLISAWWAIMAMVKRNSELFKGVGFGACMGIIALLIHSAVDFNLQIPANAYMFVLLLALAAVARWTPHKSEKTPETRRGRSAHYG
jgi:O-antigen ligase